LPADRMTLSELNALSLADFRAKLAPVFENAPWVAEAVEGARPFASLTALHKVMLGRLAAMPDEAAIAFLRGHPRLSPETLRLGTTAESAMEQTAAGLDALDAATSARLGVLNATYEKRFGFPFILAIRHASVATLAAAFERRLAASPGAERMEAMEEVGAISWTRLLDRLQPAPTGGLSTHVLDTVRAAPAVGLGVVLWREENGRMALVEAFETNANGASDGALLEGGRLRAGTYEFRYDASTYFAGRGYATPARVFLGTIGVTFSVWNPEEHFHVPLLLAPGSYVFYRGG
jgi:2-oxo-4-hydroxy-4-carboxy-5-ureidoimidazoline decarboxylase